MKIVSYNVNGIRASAKLGLVDYIKKMDADVFCIQEVRANESVARGVLFPEQKQLSLFDTEPGTPENKLANYTAVFNCGTVPGYAGTLTLCKQKPDKVIFNMDEFWTDAEGRTTTVVFGNLAVVNAYIPNGNSGRLDFKMHYLDALNKFIKRLKKTYIVVCVGDFNIAHTEIDLTNPKECRNKSVYLPIECEALSKILDSGFIDTFRFLNPTLVKYSWRSYRSVYDKSYNAWKYRIDYILASNNLKNNLVFADIEEQLYSDHLPCVLEFEQ